MILFRNSIVFPIIILMTCALECSAMEWANSSEEDLGEKITSLLDSLRQVEPVIRDGTPPLAIEESQEDSQNSSEQLERPKLSLNTQAVLARSSSQPAIVSARRDPAKEGHYGEITQFGELLTYLLEKRPEPIFKVEETSQNEEESASINGAASPTPFENYIFFLTLDSLAYEGPTNSALMTLKGLDNTDHTNPEALIHIMGIQDGAFQQKIQRCCHSMEADDARTMDEEEEVASFEDNGDTTPLKPMGKGRKISFSALKTKFETTKLKAKSSLDKLNLQRLSSKLKKGKPEPENKVAEEAIDKEEPSATDMWNVRHLIEKSRNTWVFFSKDILPENQEFFDHAATSAGVSIFEFFEETKRANIPTQYLPMEEELGWYIRNFRSMGATMVVYSPNRAYNSAVGEFMKQIGIVQEDENPEAAYCYNPLDQDSPGIASFSKTPYKQYARIIIVDNLLKNLTSNRHILQKLFPYTPIDLIHSKQFLSLTTPQLLGSQHKAIKRYPE